MVSIIIPSLDGHRGGSVPRLLTSLDRQTFRDYEVHLVKGIKPQGRAINEGARRARGEILLILDDDACLADDHVVERVVNAVSDDPSVGMAGASIVVDPEVSTFQQRASRQFPRFNMPVLNETVDSDMACHGCCAIPARVFFEVGGEREDIVRGLDPDLRVRLRDHGYRVVLVKDTRVYHPLPDGWGKLIRLFFRNGFGSAYSRKYSPDSVFETDERVDGTGFRPVRPFAYRLVRFPVRLLRAALRGQEMRLVGYTAYAAGYLWGLATARPLEPTGRTAPGEGQG